MGSLSLTRGRFSLSWSVIRENRGTTIVHNVVVEKPYVFVPPYPGQAWPKFPADASSQLETGFRPS